MKSKKELRQRVMQLTDKANGIRAMIEPFLGPLKHVERELYRVENELHNIGDCDKGALVALKVMCRNRCCIERRTTGVIFDSIEQYTTWDPVWYVIREIKSNGKYIDHYVPPSDFTVLKQPEE